MTNRLYLALLVVSLITFYLLLRPPANDGSTALTIDANDTDNVTIVTVICGRTNLEEAIVMVKSAVAFRKQVHPTFILLCEVDLQALLTSELLRMREATRGSFSYRVMNLSYPVENEDEWMKLDKLCATQVLFLPIVLADVNRVLYVDTDVIFVDQLSKIYRPMRLMAPSHFAGLVAENKYDTLRTKTLFFGLNSGVVYMKLDEMRKFNWNELVRMVYLLFRNRGLYRGDQGIFNALYHFNPDRFYLCSCRFNYRFRLLASNKCLNLTAEKGISILHGATGAFQTSFPDNYIYKCFLEYELGTDLYANLLQPLENTIEMAKYVNHKLLLQVTVDKLIRTFVDHLTES